MHSEPPVEPHLRRERQRPALNADHARPPDSQPGLSVGASHLPVDHATVLPAEIVHLAERAAERLAQRPENTSRAYAADWKAWTVWCDTWGGNPSDPEPGAVATYVEHLVDLGKAPSTVDRALTGLRAGLIEAGHGKGAASDRLELARQRTRMYQADAAAAGYRETRAKAITISDLRTMIEALDLTSLAGLRDRAMLLLGFCAALRRSEVAALDWTSVEDVSEGLVVTVWRGKTKRLDDVPITYGTSINTCPVRALAAWHDAAVENGAREDGPVFVRIDRHGNLGNASSGSKGADGRLTPQAIGTVIKRSAERSGLDGHHLYSGHSLRRGFATEARRAGADSLRIARVGGWADGSAQLWKYVEDVDRWSEHPLRGVGI